MPEKNDRLVRLLHLVSPSLPTGAFAYSQGLEWAVAEGWVVDATDLERWLTDAIENSLARVDLPLLVRMMDAVKTAEHQALCHWCDLLLAFRETAELRQEEKSRGQAMRMLLEGLGLEMNKQEKAAVAGSQLAGFALAATRWCITPFDAAMGYLWSWLENQVLAGIKIIPLGQTDGHRILFGMDGTLMQTAAKALHRDDHDIGAASPALAIASSRHETQYTRLYRS